MYYYNDNLISSTYSVLAKNRSFYDMAITRYIIVYKLQIIYDSMNTVKL